MSNLKIKLIKKTGITPIILLDNQEIFFKRKENVFFYETEINKEEVDLKIFNVNEFEHKFWIIFAILFYLITIFGIFNSKYDKSGIKLNYTGKIKMEASSDLTIEINTFAKGRNPVNIQSNCEIIEKENTVYIEQKIKKRFKLFLILKVLFWITIIFLAFFLLGKIIADFLGL